MLVEARPGIAEMTDEIVASVSERFETANPGERLQGLKAVLLGVSAVAEHSGIPVESQAGLGLLFDFRSRVSGHLSAIDSLANLLSSQEVSLLPEEDQELAGRIVTAIAM